MSQNIKNIENLPGPSEIDQEKFRLADIRAEHNERLYATDYDEPSLAQKAAQFAAERHAGLVASLGDMAEQILEPHEIDPAVWDPDDALTKVMVIREISTNKAGQSAWVPAIRFERTVPPAELKTDKPIEGLGLGALAVAYDYEDVSMAEIDEHGAMVPVGDFDEADVRQGQSMVDELLQAQADPDNLPHLSSDLSTVIHPRITELINRSNLHPEDS